MKKRIKTAIKTSLQKRGYVVHRNENMHVLTPLLERFLEVHGQLFFIQVGANDGVRNDPLHDFIVANKDRVSGLALEPIGEYFDKLVENYRGCPGVVPVKKAIHCSEKQATMYLVDSSKSGGLPLHSSGITSFHKNHHERSGIPKECVNEVCVECQTFGELIEEHDVERVDMIQVDAEGYDFDIVMSLDLETIRPSILRFETGYWGKTMTPPKVRELAARLRAYGYDILPEQRDMTAYLLDSFLQPDAPQEA